MREASPSHQVVSQRIRNRIIEYLEVACSFEKQRAYQRSVPHVGVPSEMINQWEDWVDWERLATYLPPAFSPDEHRALTRFHAMWELIAAEVPDPLPVLEETLKLPAWMRLADEAQAALSVLVVRGKMPEDHEI